MNDVNWKLEKVDCDSLGSIFCKTKVLALRQMRMTYFMAYWDIQYLKRT